MKTVLRLCDISLEVTHEFRDSRKKFSLKGGEQYYPPHHDIQSIKIEGHEYELLPLMIHLDALEVIEAELSRKDVK